MLPLVQRTAEAPSAGGAPIDQILVVAGFTAVVYAAILWVMARERTGHKTLVGRAADAASLAFDILGLRVHHEIGAERQRPLQHGREEAVVDAQ